MSPETTAPPIPPQDKYAKEGRVYITTARVARLRVRSNKAMSLLSSSFVMVRCTLAMFH